ncbi:hypothetical protein DSM106972_047150 [Dulcicalothrix desertica PCC 7102]|uniref:Uncharacterized protein n=1 Tax=Dulcicalothrix desertica PCC 7102 TaxID=232991 RepID=A0A433VCG1_9CYAN|nr:hypothetical protein [Dulcicalothrix desertica]RUT03801.1 hypothetical protein DSM106972_047150 [Dulcicalothrix desertica PCC 7102]TWH43790.1 hypothetical protein CAL7102_07534 [Dulcicalothrix desertica PCC 7102]
MLFPTLIAQSTPDNSADAAVGITLVTSSIELSKQTVESWNKAWGDAINPSGALWAGLCNLGTTLAALSIILLAVKMASDYQEKRFLWSELAASLIYPLVIALFLGNNGYLLSQSVLLIRNIGHQQVVGVLNIQLADTTFKSAISNVTLTQSVKTQISTVYAECQGKTGKPLTDCLQEKRPVVEQILASAEKQNNGPLEEARKAVAELTNFVQNPGAVFSASISLILITFLYALQWAFVNILEAALIMTATFAPIALGLSLLPLGSKPIWAWASGFIALFGVQLGYNIVVGLAATVIVAAGAQSASDLAFLTFISIFAPALALLIAGGGGVALYTGINSRVPALVNAAFDGVVAVTTGLVGKI